MPNVEWDVAQDLVTPYGTVLLNQPAPITGYLYLVQPDYKIVPSLRVSQDPKSQADGSVLHPRFKTGLVASLTVEYRISVNGTDAIDATLACGSDLRVMHEALTGALNSIRELTDGTQRLIWTPTGTGGSRRMLDFIQALSWTEPRFEDAATFVSFSVESPFPYGIDFTQTETVIASGGSAVLTNNATADFYPVMKVYGPTSNFTITNTTSGLSVVYDSTRPGAASIGGGDYAEIDFFRGTVFLNGDSSDLIAGLDPTATDLFPLVYEGGGTNTITVSGATVHVLWNRAWS